MLKQLMQRLLGQSGEPRSAEAAVTEQYNGYTIHAMPRKDPDGWRVAGRIEREADGEPRVHEFIRADAFPDREDAVTITLRKGRQMVDQMGERMFE